MLNKEKLNDAVETFVAEMIAEKIVDRIQDILQGQWNQVINELAYSRKNNEKLKEVLATALTQCSHLESMIERYHAQQKVDDEIRRKASEILRTATKELGLSE